MPKTLAEEIREMMNKVDEAMGRDYKTTVQVDNWEDQGPDVRTLGINYTVSGKYRPAFWDDSGGGPEEHPEIDVDVYDAETGELMDNLPSYLDKEIDQAIQAHIEQQRNDVDPPDRYDDDRI